MKHVIVTGASRGLGRAIVELLLQPANTLFCVARSVEQELFSRAEEASSTLHWIEADLSVPQCIEPFMASIADQVVSSGSEGITLINNAGILSPMGLVGSGSSVEIDRAIRVNLTAPIVLTHAFVASFANADCPRTVINISSGAGSRAMAGLSTYSTTKAGLNMFTKAAAVEQEQRQTLSDNIHESIRFFAVSPGTVDTSMQDQLRNADEHALPDRETYRAWKRDGSLIDPRSAAQKILSLIDRTDIQSGSYIHAKEL
ncbi:MAG: SDR family NAD(P)-dependent oxidoreductase [Spirochaetales bacterium]